MKVCVFGAGAVGGHLAGRLAKGGAEVSVVTRGAHLAAIQANGLTVEAEDGEIHAGVEATDDPKRLGAQDAGMKATYPLFRGHFNGAADFLLYEL